MVFVNVDETGLNAGGFRENANFVTNTNIVGNGRGTATIPAQSYRGITPQVSLAWDRSENFRPAPHTRVYLVYTDSPSGINHHDTDVFVRYSDNSGVDWSNPPKLVHSADLHSQFLPSIAVDQTTGFLGVVWLDARNDPATARVELYATVSADGGQTYEPITKVAAQLSHAYNANRQQWGTASANSGNSNLWDNTQTWTPNHYWRNYQVWITAGVAQGEEGTIRESYATELRIQGTWAVNNPQLGDRYEIGLDLGEDDWPWYSFDYGEYTGLAFHNG